MSSNDSRPARRTFLKTAVALPATAMASENGDAVRSAEGGDALRVLPPGDVHIGGWLGRRIDLSIENRIKAQNYEELVEPFRHRTETHLWQTEFWGKWVTSAASAYEYTRDTALADAVRRSASELIATQTPDGYIGNYAPGHHLGTWDIWGRKYTILGLLACYRVTGERPILDAARRVADHLLGEVGPGKADIVKTGAYWGMASSSVLEPMVLLFRETGESRYLDFARYIVSRWSSPEGPQLVGKALAEVPVARRFPLPRTAQWYGPKNGQKAYEMMSCYEGLLELYRTDQVETYREAALKTAADIRATEILLTGSGSSRECWYDGRRRAVLPARSAMETCVTMTWMKWCANLLRLTGTATFADEIERSAYNALLAAMTPDGSSFTNYTLIEGFRTLGPNQCGMKINCCVANGPRAVMLLPRVAVMAGPAGPVVNFYGEISARLKLPSGTRLELRQRSDYPVSGTVVIELRPARTERFPVALRIPAWSSETTAAVNDEALKPVSPGGYLTFDRTWRPGDRIRLRLDLRGRIHGFTEGDRRYSAVTRGPILLARDSRLDPGHTDEVCSLAPEPDGSLALEPAATPTGIWMGFRARFHNGPHERKGTLTLCDFASAGNRWRPDNRYRVWIPARFDPSA